MELATRVPSGGLLLISALDSVSAAASRFYFWAPVALLASQRFDSMAKAPRVTVPVVQVHAPEDFLIPIDAARTLFRRFAGRKVLLEIPGGHNDVGFRGDALASALAEFWPTPPVVSSSQFPVSSKKAESHFRPEAGSGKRQLPAGNW